MLPHVAKSSVGVFIDNSTVWTKGQLPLLSFNDKRQPCVALVLCWKFDNRNSLSVPTQHIGGTTAVNQHAPMLVKEDRATGRYLSRPLQVYKGTQSAVAVNWSREHSARRPSSWRTGGQWSVITSGRSDSDAAAQGMKHSEVSMSFLEGVVPAFNPRRLNLMCWIQQLLAAKVSNVLGRMSSSVTPLGRTTARGSVLLSSSSLARFFGGDVCRLPSSSGHFWLRPGSHFGIEVAWGISIERSASSPSDIMTAATSSGLGSGRVLSMFDLSLFTWVCSIWPPLHPFASGVLPHHCQMCLVHLVLQGPNCDLIGPPPTSRSQAFQVPLASQVDECHQQGQMIWQVQGLELCCRPS